MVRADVRGGLVPVERSREVLDGAALEAIVRGGEAVVAAGIDENNDSVQPDQSPRVS